MLTDGNPRKSEDRKLILIVEDEFVSREILRRTIEDDYDLLLAANGAEALEHIRNNGNRISLALLDLNLPDMNGLEILRLLQEREENESIPAIVLTSDIDAEVDSLDIGAADFIPKPYPRAKVIKARIRRTIELYEKRVIIESTEYDPMTGLYNREFFFHYAGQADAGSDGMDAIDVDIDRFRMINELYGRDFADSVLRHLGDSLRDIAERKGGLAGRRTADNFMIYIPHGDDHEKIYEEISSEIAGAGRAASNIRLRMGVYPRADREPDAERRFDRARTAANSVRNQAYGTAIGTYDEEFDRESMFRDQLVAAFPEAVEQQQFKVYFQPKYDITGDVPVLCSAEALVRWIHPESGFINPGVFIETFESNGLISRLDKHVWEMTARQIRDWRDRLGTSVPVSVNVSRADLFDPDICGILQKVVEDSGIRHEDLLLEVTESSYARDTDRIIEAVKDLRDAGFHVEMDDFGSGYSSLNMLMTMPVDALKLDMQFVRTAFAEDGDTGILEIALDIAKLLGIPVVAEGVETEEQMLALKHMGCDIAQGYYFSKPVPADEFERFFTGRDQ